MNVTDYWPMAMEYSIWKSVIASLQFWTADLDPVTLHRATEEGLLSIFLFIIKSYTPSAI